MKYFLYKGYGKIYFFTCCIIFSLVFVSFSQIIALSSNVRMVADDFCYSAAITKMGLFKFLLNYYLTWGGRISSFIFFNAINVFGDAIVTIFPPIMLVMLSLGFYKLFRMLVKRKYLLIYVPVLSMIVPFAVLLSLPDINQSFFWFDGAQHYFFSIIWFVWFIIFSLLVNDKSSVLVKVLFGSYVLLGCGFNEPLSFTLISFACLLKLISLTTLKFFTAKIQILNLFLVISMIGFGLSIFAPGNFLRAAVLTGNEIPGILNIVKTFYYNIISFLYLLLSERYILVIGVFLLFVFLGFLQFFSLKISTIKMLLFVSSMLFLVSMIPLSIFNPVSRSFAFPSFLFLLFLMFLSYLIGQETDAIFGNTFLKQNGLVHSTVLIVVCIAFFSQVNHFYRNNYHEFVSFASSWETREAIILKKKDENLNLTIPQMVQNPFGLGNYFDDLCVLDFYQIKSIVIQTKE